MNETKQGIHVIDPNKVDPDILIPNLLTFFAKMVGAKNEFDLKKVNAEVILDAMLKSFANLLAESDLIPREILEHLESINVGPVRSDQPDVQTHSDKDCEDCDAKDLCDSVHEGIASKVFH